MPVAKLDFGKGKVFPVDVALDMAFKRGNVEGWTYELLRGMLDEQQDRGQRISTTTLIAKCPRQGWLMRRNDYTEKPKLLWASFRGTMYHGRLETAVHPLNIAEARYHTYLPGRGILTGSPDIVEVPIGGLLDYKTTKEAPSWRPWDDHIKQVEVNRWLVDKAWGVEHLGEFFLLRPDMPTGACLPEGLNVNDDWRENVARFVPKEWSRVGLVYLDDKGPHMMLVERSEEVMGKTTGRLKKAKVADIWTDDVVESLVTERYDMRLAEFAADTIPPIPDTHAMQQHPLCPYCPVRNECWVTAMNGQ